VTEIEYSRTSSHLLNEVKEIEDFLGRKKTYRYGPRLIDIDIIFFNNENNSSKELTIPHYDWRNRLFVVEPLCEIINVFDIADFNLNDQKVEKKGSITYK
jgi:2-amino-4-hydroxy-6-hydroxymethyldihydropteridine diphosphokinase